MAELKEERSCSVQENKLNYLEQASQSENL